MLSRLSLEDFVLLTYNKNHTTSLCAYAHPLCSPLFCISAHKCTTLPPYVFTWTTCRFLCTRIHTQTQTYTHASHWLTPFKEHFRSNQGAPIPNSLGRGCVLLQFSVPQPLQLLRRQKSLLTDEHFVQSQTKHHLQVTIKCVLWKMFTDGGADSWEWTETAT